MYSIVLRPLLLLSTLIVALTSAFAQNLVPNPSFEDFTVCPPGYNGGYGPLFCEPWFVPTNGSSDYFNACHVGVVGVPNNAFGVQPAHTGVAYAGGLYYYAGIGNYREYLQVQLTEPLVAGQSYDVSLFYSKGALTCGIDKLGIYISATQITDPGSTGPLGVQPQLELVGLVDNADWQLLTDCYVAVGGEEWITIGNYYTDAEIALEAGCPLWQGMVISYIFIDDVSVEEGPPPGVLDFTLGDDLVVCDEVVLEVPINNANYNWQDGSHNQTFTVTETGEYHVTVSKGCNVGYDTILVEVNYSPDPIDLGDPEQIICPGESISYNFDPNLGDYVWQDGSTSSSYDITTSGVYSVTITTICGSEEDVVNVIGLDPPAPIDLGMDTTLCLLTDLVLMFDPMLGDFVWQDGSANPTFTVTEPGTYALTISNICGEVSDSIEVEYYPEPLVLFNEDTVSLCEGETVQFSFDPEIGEYVWQDGEYGSDYTVTEPGTYSVTVVNPCGSDFASIVVTYDYEPTVNLGPDITLCPQQFPYTFDLTGLADVEHFVWDDGTTDPTFIIYEEGGYGVTVSNDCFEVWDFIDVFVEDAPPLVELPGDTTLCAGEVLFLDVGNITGTYQWQDNSSDAIYGVTQSGTYSVTVSNACGEDSDTIVVEYGDPLPFIDLGPDLSICPGEEVTFYTGVTGIDYVWNDGSTLDSIVISDAAIVILVISNDCATASDTVEVVVEGVIPEAGLPTQLGLCAGDSVTFGTIVTGATYVWNTGMTSSSITATVPGQYILTVTNSCGMDVDTTNVVDLGTALEFDLGPDQSICEGDTILFDPGIAGTYVWQDGSTNMFYTAGGPGEISLSITNACGAYSDTVELTLLDPIPVLDLGPDTSICPGASVLLAPGISNVIYTWSNGSMDTSLMSNAAGTIFLDISNACGISSDTMIITLLPDAPVINLGADFFICPGDTVVLTPGIANADYLWQDGSTGNTYSVSAGAEIILTLSNSCGSATDTVIVTENTTAPVLDLGEDIAVCEGETVLVDPGITGVSYLWQDGSSGTSFLATSTALIILEISNACGADHDTLNIVIDGVAPEVDLGPDTLLCDGEILTLVVDNANAMLVWQDGSSSSTQLISTPGLYSVVATNMCGVAQDSVFVLTQQSPEAFDLGPDQLICAGDVITLQGPVITAGSNLMWNTGSMATQIEVSVAGEYALSVFNVCGETSDTVTIDVDANELVDVTDNVFPFCTGDELVLDVQQPIAATYLWNNGSTIAQLPVSNTGAYSVTITSACDDLTEEFIVQQGDCLNPNIFVPNVFSPNGDNINDVFRIDLDDRDIIDFQISIYDRWGEVVFSSLDPHFEWKGDMAAKSLLPGVYVYQVLITRQDGGKEVLVRLKGDVTLIR